MKKTVIILTLVACSTLTYAGVTLESIGSTSKAPAFTDMAESKPIVVNKKSQKDLKNSKNHEENLYGSYAGNGNPFRSSKAKGLETGL